MFPALFERELDSCRDCRVSNWLNKCEVSQYLRDLADVKHSKKKMKSLYDH